MEAHFIYLSIRDLCHACRRCILASVMCMHCAQVGLVSTTSAPTQRLQDAERSRQQARQSRIDAWRTTQHMLGYQILLTSLLPLAGQSNELVPCIAASCYGFAAMLIGRGPEGHSERHAGGLGGQWQGVPDASSCRAGFCCSLSNVVVAGSPTCSRLMHVSGRFHQSM